MGSVSQLVEYVLNPTLGLMGRNISISSSLLEAEKALNLLRPKECVGGMMRVGSGEDGGYLIPNQMELPSGLISPGVAEDSSFELHFAKQGVECLLIDGSVDGPPVDHPKFSFRKEWVTAYTTPGETISLADLISSLSQKKGGGSRSGFTNGHRRFRVRSFTGHPRRNAE